MFLIINFIAIILFIYLCVMFLYFLGVIYCASKERIIEVESQVEDVDYDNVFNVAIYVQNNEHTISSLIESLKRQEYNKEKYSLNVILDNCTDNSAKVLEIIGGAKLWRLTSENGEPKGKEYAIRWFFDRIFVNDTSDAFVFLNGDVTLRPDFLSKLSKEVNRNPIVSGITLNRQSFMSMIGQVIGYRKIFLNTIIYTGRNIAKLLNYLNDDVFAVKKNLLMEIKDSFEKDNLYEFEVPIVCANKGVNIRLSTDVRVFKQYYESSDNVLKFFNSLSISKFKLLKKHYKSLLDKEFSPRAKEFILTGFYPGEFFIFLACAFLIKFTPFEGYVLGPYLPWFIANCYLIGLFYLGTVAKFNIQKMFFWFCWIIFSPVALIVNLILNFDNLYTGRFRRRKKEEEENSESTFVDVLLTDGEQEVVTKIEIIEKDALFRVVFWYNNKQMSSRECIKLSDAMAEISDKLMERGFALKVCQNCGYFELDSRGRACSDRGNCYMLMIARESNIPDKTFVWDYCDKMIPLNAREFVKKELEKLED